METTRQPSPLPLADADYEAIEAAVMETERGRWFLAEFARRNRTADTAKVLTAVRRLELAVGAENLPINFEEIVRRLDGLRALVARATIDAGLSAEGTPGESASPGGDATRQAAEAATARIRRAADHIGDIADRLKDQRPDLVERLETSMVQIHSAAALHDLSTQRLSRLATSMKAIETQVGELAAMAGRSAVGLTEPDAEPAKMPPADAASEEAWAKERLVIAADALAATNTPAPVASAPSPEAPATPQVQTETPPPPKRRSRILKEQPGDEVVFFVRPEPERTPDASS